ncbi:hypothetical protein IH982_01270 [Patescibacteria group bacterium]|nr:hypothetical protein [Patescibacteria group bacterium]
MSKNVAIGVVVVILVVVAGAFFIFRGEEAFDVSLFEKDEAELTSIGNDIEMLSQDAVLDELEQTFGDILEGAGISAAEALDESSIALEALEADLSQTLDAFASDDAVLQELDQAFGDVSQ